MTLVSQIQKAYVATVPVKNITRLSIFLSENHFQFCLSDKSFKQIQLIQTIDLDALTQFRSIEEKISHLIKSHQLTASNFQQVSICLHNTIYTLIPESFYKPENVKQTLEFSSGQQIQTVFTHSFQNMKFSFSPQPNLMNLLEKEFKNATIKSSGIVAIELFFTNSSLKTKDVWINFLDNSIEILAKRDKDLIYYNTFRIENKEEVLYYLLFMAEQFGLDPEKLKLVVSGNILVNSEVHELLKKYIRHVSFAVNAIRFTETSWQLPEHFYFSLVNQHLCGS
ncbi:MAG: DUF3822 family protein [Sphingobacteriaceae bacterium]|nr:DUF3822 family protein [Sphingobacteriaceae bacterium]